MSLNARTFRIFVSSTFGDLKAERDALQQYVFPRLRDLCRQHGCRFQAIDLRWGVSEEAGLDQQTMTICLDEIARCRRTSPRPNFIILLGDRYGWRPLPPKIPAVEYEAALEGLNEAERARLEEWYLRDDNAIPAEYYLKPRERGGLFEDSTAWSTLEHELLSILQKATQNIPLGEYDRLKYGASATEQEITRGALLVNDARDHVFAFFRTIRGLPGDSSASEYVDLDPDGRLDEACHQRLERLKQQLRQALPSNIHDYEARWIGTNQDPITTDHVGALPERLAECLALGEAAAASATLCVEVWQRLSRVILNEIAQIESMDPLDREISAHDTFRAERSRSFVGRDAALERIMVHLGGVDTHPLAVYGASGSGKSALMAAAIAKAHDMWPNSKILFRFVGATPASSNTRSLLRGLCEQLLETFNYEGELHARLGQGRRGDQDDDRQRAKIRAKYDVAGDIAKLVDTFQALLEKVPDGERLILFVDSVDGISGGDEAQALFWLPATLPEKTRIVVSTMPDAALTALTQKLPPANIYQLSSMPPEEGSRLLDLWLAEAGRTLQPFQRVEVLRSFAANGLPLFLRFAFEEACRWKSTQHLPAGANNVTGFSPALEDMISDMLWRLEQPARHGQVLVSRALGYLGASRKGLTEDELLDLLSRDQDVLADFKQRSPRSPNIASLPVVIWSRLYFDLEPYLTEQSANDTSLLTFYHRQLREVITANYLSGGSKVDRHRGLASYFDEQALEFVVEGNSLPNQRKVFELPYQQIQAGVWGELERTLTSLQFIEAKAAAGIIYDLETDYYLALSTWPQHRQPKPTATPAEPITDWLRACTAAILAEHPDPHPDKGAGPVLGVLRTLPEDQRERDCRLEESEMLLYGNRKSSASIVPEQMADHPLDATNSGRTNSPEVDSLISKSEPDGRVKEDYFGLLDSTAPVIRDIHRSEETSASGIHPESADTPTGRLQAFNAFVSSYSHLLQQTPRETVVMAYNYAASGVVSEQASLLAQTLTRGWLARDPRPLLPPLHPVCRRTLEGHTGAVDCVALSSDARLAISGSWDELRVWDLITGACLRTLTGHQIRCVALSPDGRIALSGGWDGRLRIWDVATGECSHILETPGEEVSDVALSADQRVAVSAGSKSLRVWDIVSGQCARAIDLPGGPYGGADAGMSPHIALTVDAKLALSADANSIQVWDIVSGTCLHTYRNVCTGFSTHKPATSIALTPNGRTAVSSGADRDDANISLWDIPSGRRLGIIRYESSEDSYDTGIAITADGRIAVSAKAKMALHVWDMASGERLRTLEGHTDRVNAVALTPDGRVAISASSDGTLRVWDIASGVKSMPPDLRDSPPSIEREDDASCRTPDDGVEILLVSSGEEVPFWSEDRVGKLLGKEHSVMIRDRSSHTVLGMLDEHNVDGKAAVTADGTIAVVPVWNRVSVWDLTDARRLHVLRSSLRWLHSVALTPDGKICVAAGSGAELSIWGIASGHHLGRRGPSRQSEPSENVSYNDVCVTGDGRLAVSAGDAIDVWDLSSNQRAHGLVGHAGRVWSLRITPDGRLAVSGSPDGTLRVWNVITGECLAIYQAGGAAFISSAIQPDGGFLCAIRGGETQYLTLRSITVGPPLVTAVRLFRIFTDLLVRYQSSRYQPKLSLTGLFDTQITARCPWCRRRSGVPATIFHTIDGITRAARLAPDESPCRVLPPEAWDEKRLVSECPLCHRTIKFNPFLVDGRNHWPQ